LYCTDGDSDKENVDPNIIIISDDESAARGETGRPWWMSPSAGLFEGDEPAAAASSTSAGPSSDADFFEDRVLHLRYLYQLSMEQRIRLIIKEIMQGV